MTLLATLAAGLVLGVVTQLLQGILPGALNWIANSMSSWLVVAFLAGSRMPSPRAAAVMAPLMLLAAVAGYYATVQVRFGYGANTSILVFWGFGAVAGGLVFGSAGWWWRHGGFRARVAAIGLLAALLVAEGVYFLMILPVSTVGLGAIVAGLIVPVVLGRDRRERGWGYAAVLPGRALGAIGYSVTLLVCGVLGGA